MSQPADRDSAVDADGRVGSDRGAEWHDGNLCRYSAGYHAS